MNDPDPPPLISTRWKTFVRVAQLGSLTKAAAALDMQQSAISVQISALEQACRGRLFSRTGRGVVLTSLGELAFSRVQEIISDAEHLTEEILAASREPTGAVRVGVVSSLAHPFANQLFRASMLRHPRVRLHISEGFSGQIDEWLANGMADIGIVHRYGRRVVAGAEKLFEGPSCLVRKRSARGADVPSQVTFHELDKLPLVLPGMPSGLRLHLEQIAKRKGIHLNVAMEANSLEIVKDVVVEGGFSTILPFQAVHREVSGGLLTASRITSPSITRSAALLTTTQRPLSFAARETTKVVLETIAALQRSGIWEPEVAAEHFK